MESHRWSGWPGAWCLDCGVCDKEELCISEGHDPDECNDPAHKNESCKESRSHAHDPYFRVGVNEQDREANRFERS